MPYAYTISQYYPYYHDDRSPWSSLNVVTLNVPDALRYIETKVKDEIKAINIPEYASFQSAKLITGVSQLEEAIKRSNYHVTWDIIERVKGGKFPDISPAGYDYSTGEIEVTYLYEQMSSKFWNIQTTTYRIVRQELIDYARPSDPV